MVDKPLPSNMETLLQELRDGAAPPDLTQFDEVKLVQTIRARVNALPGLAHPQPEIATLLQTVRQYAAQSPGQVRFQDVGTVQHIGNGVARLSGLPQAQIDEVVIFPTGVQGLVLNLERQHVDVILLGADKNIQGGDLVLGTGEPLRVPVGSHLLGRVVNALGQPLDENGPMNALGWRPLEQKAPGIVARQPVNQPLHTGLTVVDALVPVGRGQRELILGDRQTGKTTIAVDTILNQADSGVKCIYVAVGQKKSTTLGIIELLQRTGALAYTIVVMSSPDDPTALRYLAPYAGCTMGEALMDEGHDVLIVYDDLSKHANAYRELSLLLRRPPGREAYPGDIFYLHARLLERAGKFRDGTSLTALPIVQTQRGNVAAYIPTNLISITDGQIILDADLFNQGIKPAVHAGLSVSRVGGAAQTAVMKSVAGHLRLELAQFEEVARFARFGADVDDATRQQIERGRRLQALLIQPPHQPLSQPAQLLMLLAAVEGQLDDMPETEIPAFARYLRDQYHKQYPELWRRLQKGDELDPVIQTTLLEKIGQFRAQWRERQNDE